MGGACARRSQQGSSWPPIEAREIVLQKVGHDGYGALRAVAVVWRCDRAVVLTAVKENGHALHFADDGLNGDREIVLAAVLQNGLALVHATKALQSDRDVVLTAVRQNGHALKHATETLRADRDVVLAAVRQNGDALDYALETLGADREIVLALVQKNGGALRYAPEALRADRDVVLAAVQQNANALDFAADCLLKDPTFAKEAKSNRHLLKLTMLSGRSTVVIALHHWDVEMVLHKCRSKLGLVRLEDDGSTMELLHCSGERVPCDGTEVLDWPGVQPLGEISEV